MANLNLETFFQYVSDELKNSASRVDVGKAFVWLGKPDRLIMESLFSQLE